MHTGRRTGQGSIQPNLMASTYAAGLPAGSPAAGLFPGRCRRRRPAPAGPRHQVQSQAVCPQDDPFPAGTVPPRVTGHSHAREVAPGQTRPGQLMQAPYYDRDGRPVSQEQWQQLGRQPGYSRIGYHDAVRHGQQVTVITFWSGIAGHGPDGPLIFCTCAGIRIPGGPRPAFQRLWGWPDIAAARAGHQAVTAWITGIAGFLAGHASQLPPPDPAPPGTPLTGERPASGPHTTT